jgi:hypothetical protein
MFPSSGLIETEICYSTNQRMEFLWMHSDSAFSGLTTDARRVIP